MSGGSVPELATANRRTTGSGPHPDEATESRSGWSGLVYVAAAVLLFSTSPVLVRLAGALSAYEITFGRVAIAAVVVGVVAAITGQTVALVRGSVVRFALYGLVTALHFLFYIASLSYTTVAHSLALVYTAPIFVTLFAGLLIREPLPWWKWVGIPVTVVGVGVLAGFEPALDQRMIVGDLLALGSAICFGFYSIAGREARHRYPLLGYAALVYGFAALWSLPAAVLLGTGQWTFGATGWVALLGLGPLALGHTLYNASLRRAHPTYVNLVATQEVTGGVLLGAIVLAEVPGVATLLGILLTLVGVAIVVRD